MKKKIIIGAAIGLSLLLGAGWASTKIKKPVTIKGNMMGMGFNENLEDRSKSKISSVELVTEDYGRIDCKVPHPKEGRFLELEQDWHDDLGQTLHETKDMETVTGYMQGGKCYVQQFEINGKTYKFE